MGRQDAGSVVTEEVHDGCQNIWNDGSESVSVRKTIYPPKLSCITDLQQPTLLQLWTFKLSHGLGRDSLVRLGWLKHSSMDFLAMTLELVFATKVDLVIFAARVRASEILGLDAMDGRGMAFEVAPAFGNELAVDLAASITSRLAVVGSLSLVPK